MTTAYAEARSAIANRLAAATQAGDARRADAYAACFTETGTLQLDEAITGRAAIRDWMSAPSVISQPTDAAPGPNAGYVSHHLTTQHIELTSESTAKARTYWFVITAIGPDHSGYYEDLLERHGPDWLIAHRRPRTLWHSPQSLVRPVPPRNGEGGVVGSNDLPGAGHPTEPGAATRPWAKHGGGAQVE